VDNSFEARTGDAATPLQATPEQPVSVPNVATWHDQAR